MNRDVYRRIATIVTAGLLVLGVLAPPAAATFPGSNGRIAIGTADGLFTRTLKNSETTRIAPQYSLDPSYSANGKKVVYLQGSLDFGPGWTDIWIMNADGSGKKNLTQSPNRFSSPSFHPGGKRIIVTLYDGNPMGYQRLYTLKTDGSDFSEFAPRVGGAMDGGVYSPDGTHVAYSGGNQNSLPQLRTIRASGKPGSVKNLAPKLRTAHDPNWSPNGKRLVFTRRIANQFQIFRINRNGSGRRKLAAYGADTGAMEPVWSPNGKRILFVRADFSGGSVHPLWTMKPDGTGKSKVRGARAGTFGPAWQPR